MEHAKEKFGEIHHSVQGLYIIQQAFPNGARQVNQLKWRKDKKEQLIFTKSHKGDWQVYKMLFKHINVR